MCSHCLPIKPRNAVFKKIRHHESLNRLKFMVPNAVANLMLKCCYLHRPSCTFDVALISADCFVSDWTTVEETLNNEAKKNRVCFKMSDNGHFYIAFTIHTVHLEITFSTGSGMYTTAIFFFVALCTFISKVQNHRKKPLSFWKRREGWSDKRESVYEECSGAF